ncbi:MAG TPA: hypothetical protein PL070_01110, partial [Flavobacteriales bacterium]|nr:hypothetical protein [Flavobacteriales bacterium]
MNTSIMSLTISTKPFKYEVAFSFLAQDETVALTISDLLQDRLSTFVYSQKQKDLVGRDGMIAFREVFENEARIVVILYREEWGTTEWTRVEEEAIKDRVREEGPDFLVLVNLDKGKPKWLSRGHMRMFLERFGLKETVAVIEKRVEEFGGILREETLDDQFERHKRELKRRRDLVSYQRTTAAVDDLVDEWNKLFSELQQTTERLRDGSLGYGMGFSAHRDRQFICSAQDVALGFLLTRKYSNSLEGSKLAVKLANVDHFDEYRHARGRVYESAEYLFSLNLSGERVWQNKKDEFALYSTSALIQYWFRPYLERIKKGM